MSEIRFESREHRKFFMESLQKSGRNDSYHRAFFYVIGLSQETRSHIGRLFDFGQDQIKPEGLRDGWQTGGTVRVCRLAFNLWNGYSEAHRDGEYTPYALFDCEFAPYFMEGLKIKYPEYCRDLSPARKQEYSR